MRHCSVEKNHFCCNLLVKITVNLRNFTKDNCCCTIYNLVGFVYHESSNCNQIFLYLLATVAVKVQDVYFNNLFQFIVKVNVGL